MARSRSAGTCCARNALVSGRSWVAQVELTLTGSGAYEGRTCTHERLKARSIVVVCCIAATMVIEGSMKRHRDLQGFSSGGLAPVDHLGHLQFFFLLEPNAIGHPALIPHTN